ncbi:hypothetical protein Dsin_011797 [Dipteronia sinensis]|uniref:Uncharacterized protein n=1 Tax=Dipteronia sinensis TaxID=43782 RepID=A0AAE0AI61_9ROSI|nr:hypothetical protein Dsin_011797 [Dipteronia sinensis]
MCGIRGVSSVEGDRLARLLGVQRVRCLDRYLGLPSFDTRNKEHQFRMLKEHIWNKIKGWRGQLLSAGGNEVLIRAVVKSIPTYSMSLFKLPKGFLNVLQVLCNRFWWGSTELNKKLHWESWGKPCTCEDEGALGFRNFLVFNRALLAKQIWRLEKLLGTLVAQVLKSNYFPSCSVLGNEVKKKGSFL